MFGVILDFRVTFIMFFSETELPKGRQCVRDQSN